MNIVLFKRQFVILSLYKAKKVDFNIVSRLPFEMCKVGCN